MCVAVPAQIESIEGQKATVNLAGARADVAVTLTPEAGVGDYVLVHAGFAITKIDAEEAEETLALMSEVGLI